MCQLQICLGMLLTDMPGSATYRYAWVCYIQICMGMLLTDMSGSVTYRYVWVCYSNSAKRLCTVSNTFRAIAIVYVLAVLSQISKFFDVNYLPVQFVSYNHVVNDQPIVCLELRKPFISENAQVCNQTSGLTEQQSNETTNCRHWFFAVLLIELINEIMERIHE